MTRSRPLVLVIDDDSDARAAYEVALKLEGFAVESARDGQEGFTRAVELQPALLITDLSMPGMGGLAMVRELRADDRTRHIPVITCSGQEERPQHDARVDAMLTKPRPLQVLLHEVRRLVLPAA
jgi:CheY-like chemotaxis protein